MIKLLEKVKTDFPNLTFVKDDHFKYSHRKQQIKYDSNQPQAELLLLHELGHAKLNHKMYKYDLELLNMERQAWEVVKTDLAPKYKIKVDQNLIEEILDEYRDWLYRRSLCPKCRSTAYQQKDTSYACPDCHHVWTHSKTK